MIDHVFHHAKHWKYAAYLFGNLWVFDRQFVKRRLLSGS
jgi:hypothetical protein